MARESTPVFRIPCPQNLHLRRWDDEVVVYDDGSGDTHLLSATAARVLERLLGGPATAAELDDAVASEVPRLLAELERLGLCTSRPG